RSRARRRQSNRWRQKARGARLVIAAPQSRANRQKLFATPRARRRPRLFGSTIARRGASRRRRSASNRATPRARFPRTRFRPALSRSSLHLVDLRASAASDFRVVAKTRVRPADACARETSRRRGLIPVRWRATDKPPSLPCALRASFRSLYKQMLSPRDAALARP